MFCVILGFRRQVDENCWLLGYYAASGDNSLPTFRDNLSVPFSVPWRLKMGPICRPETSVINYHHSLRNDPEERSSQALYFNCTVGATKSLLPFCFIVALPTMVEITGRNMS